MDLVWDGQDLTKRLTEPDFFKWQWEYDDRCMLMDDKGSTVTYGEARLFGKTYFGGASEFIMRERLKKKVANYIKIWHCCFPHQEVREAQSLLRSAR